MNSKPSAPLSDAVLVALARLVDDAQTVTRAPSHSDIEFHITRAGLSAGDPKTHGQTVGKAKRIRTTLSWALEHDHLAGEHLVAAMITQLRTVGGFRLDSPNYVGDEVIKDAIETFRAEGFDLSIDGELRPQLLEALSGVAVTDALHAYIRRAKRGATDAALVTGTGKDLLEATAAHILVSLYGNYSAQSNFPTLLGQAFIALGLATTHDSVADGEPPRKRVERAMFQLACAINQLRNREGTGHGRPWLPSVTDVEARIATEFMGSIAEYLLTATEAVAGGVVSR